MFLKVDFSNYLSYLSMLNLSTDFNPNLKFIFKIQYSKLTGDNDDEQNIFIIIKNSKASTIPIQYITIEYKSWCWLEWTTNSFSHQTHVWNDDLMCY